MSVRIRLKRMGKVRTPFYRIVVCDSRNKRDGRVIEEIGTYNPKAEPSIIHVDSERAQHWLGVGAQPSTPVAAILRLTGDWQRHRGEPAESTLRTPEPKRDKTEIFNEALREAHQEPKTEAVTKKAARSEKAEKPATAESAGQADEAAGEDVRRADKAHAGTASGAETDQQAASEAGEAQAAPGEKTDEA